MSYYLDKKAAPWSHTPYVRKDVRRDLHLSRIAGVKLSAALRRERRRASLDREP